MMSKPESFEPEQPGRIVERAGEVYAAHLVAGYCRADYLFATLLLVEWIGAVMFAVWVSPFTWAGEAYSIHVHIWAAIILGGLIVSLPLGLIRWRPGATSTRHAVAIGQMLMSVLWIHLMGGRIEAHFHVFGSLAFLAMYRDPKVLITASVVVALDHFLRGIFWPRSVYGIGIISPWRWLEHAVWVAFEDVVLIRGCFQSLQELRAVADRQAALEALHGQVERQVEARTAELRESEARKASIVEVALDGIVTADHAGRVIEFNPAAERIFGYRRDEILGKPLNELIVPPALRTAHDRGWQRYLDTSAVTLLGKRIEVPAMRADGSEFPIELAVCVIGQSGPPVFNAYLRDLTEQKAAEAALLEQARLTTLTADIAIALTRGDDVRGILQHCAESMVQHVDAACARIWTLDEAEAVLELRGSAGTCDLLDGPRVRKPLGQFHIGLIAQQRRPHLTNDVGEDPAHQ